MADFGMTNMQTSVVSIVSNGASVIKKLGRIFQFYHQRCYAHDVHLAVCDVMYRNRSMTHITDEDYNYDDDQDEEMYKEGFGIVIPAIASKEIPVFNAELENVLKRVRKLVKIFRRSSMKNEVLQKYVLLEQNKELSLVLDCKTRWSSMYKMIERFICLIKCISKALLDLSIVHDISRAELLFLSERKCALEITKLAVNALYCKDKILLTAEGIFRFLFFELKKRKSSLAEYLLCCVKNCIQQRRQHDMVNLIRYFQNPNLSIHDEHYADGISLLGSNTKDGVVKTATTLFCRLFWESDSRLIRKRSG